MPALTLTAGPLLRHTVVAAQSLTAGFDQVAGVYSNGRWPLCQSDYDMRTQSFTKWGGPKRSYR
jgi:hypothetical protein